MYSILGYPRYIVGICQIIRWQLPAQVSYGCKSYQQALSHHHLANHVIDNCQFSSLTSGSYFISSNKQQRTALYAGSCIIRLLYDFWIGNMATLFETIIVAIWSGHHSYCLRIQQKATGVCHVGGGVQGATCLALAVAAFSNLYPLLQMSGSLHSVSVVCHSL